jgi:hypothetical protein
MRILMHSRWLSAVAESLTSQISEQLIFQPTAGRHLTKSLPLRKIQIRP